MTWHSLCVGRVYFQWVDESVQVVREILRGWKHPRGGSSNLADDLELAEEYRVLGIVFPHLQQAGWGVQEGGRADGNLASSPKLRLELQSRSRRTLALVAEWGSEWLV